jgi:hypothetical protein
MIDRLQSRDDPEVAKLICEGDALDHLGVDVTEYW